MTTEQVFIYDSEIDMTQEDKNRQLSAELAVAPNVSRRIIRIERIETAPSGWAIVYEAKS